MPKIETAQFRGFEKPHSIIKLNKTNVAPAHNTISHE